MTAREWAILGMILSQLLALPLAHLFVLFLESRRARSAEKGP
jgi:hypothetical protein